MTCAHEFAEGRRHENDDRIRTVEVCRLCGDYRYTCEAKRLDIDGKESWGPVGKKLCSKVYPNPRREIGGEAEP